MICKRCNKPIGLIHNCKPQDLEVETPDRLARRVLSMAEAGYDTDLALLTLAQALLAPRLITSAEIEKVARALCRQQVERNHDPVMNRPPDFLQRAEDASWKHFVDSARVALKGVGYVDPSKPTN